MDVGPLELALILLAFLVLFGYKKLPDASRSLGRSLRIFRSEVSAVREEPAVLAPAIDTPAAEPATEPAAPTRGTPAVPTAET